MHKISLSKRNKQVILLYVTTWLALIFGFLASIINTRFLSPTDFGDAKYVLNIIDFVSSLLLFGFFLSGSRLLALSDDENKSRDIRGLMILILGVSAGIMIIAMIVCCFIHYDNSKIQNLFLISIPVCASPLLANYINTTAQGDNHIVRLSIARLFPSLLYVPVAYWVYSDYKASSSLMILLQLGITVIVCLAILISSKPTFHNLKFNFKILNEENKSYGLQLYWGSLFMVASNYIAGISLGAFNEDNVNVGFYTLALSITSPIAMLPAIIGTTYFKEFAKLDMIPPKVMKMTVLVTIVTFLLFILFVKPLVAFLYPEDYAPVGIYAIWLAIGYSFHGIGDMLNRYIGSHGQGKQIRNSSFATGFIKIIGFVLLVYLWDIEGALVTVIISDIVYFIMMYFYYRQFVSNRQVQEK